MSYQTCIKDREAEIEKLRNQVQISKAIVYIWYTTICILLDFDIIMLWEWKILNAFFCDQIMTKSMSSSTEGELEARVKTLTESLIQKQTTLETLSTQKNSLALQLERLEVRDLTELELIVSTCINICTTCWCICIQCILVLEQSACK